ncbi:MAG TPA: hypothetical protein VJ952_03875, partial [Opitutales bacterium]|nr:hypothetical protein [Opitutales bacterium]
GNPRACAASKARLLDMLGGNADVVETGFLSAVEARAAIRTCHLGLSPVPRHAAGKSGSIAAFISEGLPVALPFVLEGKDADEIGFFDLGLRRACITDPDLKLLTDARAAAQENRSKISVEQVALNFLNSIK